MSSNIEANRNRIWQNSANWKYSPSQLREIDFRLHLVLLALKAIADLRSETIVLAAKELNVASIISDRLTLWGSSLHPKHDADKHIDTESIRSLILVICYLANQHQELLRRSICLLEQVWEQNRSPDETTLLSSYKNRFISLYQTRINSCCNSDVELALLAWKLAIALLFYSGENGSSLLTNIILDLTPTPFEYSLTRVTAKQRFTPPTCTLEIVSKSPFYLIKSKNKLQFELRFDDPREPTRDRSVIKGDRQDLEKLETEVVRYVGQYLTSTFQPIDNINEPELSESCKDRPRLKTQGLVNHELFFGRLTHDNLDRTILSTIQLFDLMTALEAFKTQATHSNHKASPKLVLWGGIAAVGIAAVGVAKILPQPPLQPNVASLEPSSPPQKSRSDEVLPPDLPQAIAEPDLNPQPNEPLTSAKRLPPPPAVDTPKPKPDIPDPADYPLPDVAQSGLNNAALSNSIDKQTESTVVITEEAKQTNPNQVPVTTAIAPSTNAESSKLDIPSNSPGLSSEEGNQLPQEAASDIALDSPPTTNQIQQVTAYFQEQWQPPAELKQSLEYRLLLNADGSIARVSPLGKASALYLSKTNIPLDGEPFVAATSKSQPLMIRLLLSPNGRVQTFVE